MGHLRTIIVMCGFIMIGHASAACGTVCIDLTRLDIPEQSIKAASEVAGTIFEEAGLRLAWTHQVSGERVSHETCGYPDIQVIAVRVAPRTLRERVLGQAHIASGRANIYYDRIEAFARQNSLSMTTALGYVLAHELGHVLLRAHSHSRHGLMKAMWTRSESRRMAAKQLRFSAAEQDQLSRLTLASR